MINAEGIVIRRSDFSRTSQVVEFYTATHGRVATLAKGIRRRNIRFEGPVDLFYLCDIVYAPRRLDVLAPLVECKVLSSMGGVAGRLTSLYAASYVVELVHANTAAEEPNARLFQALARTLAGLARSDDPALCVNRFELKALEAEGFTPCITTCASCGNDLPPKSKGSFSGELGGLLCPGCSAETGRTDSLSARTTAILRMLASTPWPTVDNLRIPPETHVELRRIMDALVEYHLDRRPKTLDLFERAAGIAADGGGRVGTNDDGWRRKAL